MKIVDVKKCVPGQMVASLQVTDKEPEPDGDDWVGLPAAEMVPGLYRAVKPFHPEIHGQWARDIVCHLMREEASDPEASASQVSDENLKLLQEAVERCFADITLYECDDFLVRVPQQLPREGDAAQSQTRWRVVLGDGRVVDAPEPARGERSRQWTCDEALYEGTDRMAVVSWAQYSCGLDWVEIVRPGQLTAAEQVAAEKERWESATRVSPLTDEEKERAKRNLAEFFAPDIAYERGLQKAAEHLRLYDSLDDEGLAAVADEIERGQFAKMMGVVDVKDCAPGQMVSRTPVTEADPDPDYYDWSEPVLATAMQPGLYRAVRRANEDCIATWRMDNFLVRVL